MFLNLPSIIMTGFEDKDAHDYHVYAVPADEPEYCSKCVGSSLYGHGSKTQLVMDTPMHGRRVGILLECKRYKCRSCGITFIQSCNDINDRHRATNRLVQYVESKGLVTTFTSVADTPRAQEKSA